MAGWCLMGILLLACEDDPPAAVDKGEPPTRVEEQSRLNLICWEDFLSSDALVLFEEETGAVVTVTEVVNSEELKQVLVSRPVFFDVVIADHVTLRELRELRLLSDFDESFPVRAEFVGDPLLATAPDADCRYSIPYLWSMTVLAGRREAIEGREPSWNLLWNEDLKVAVLDEPHDLVGIALLSLGVSPPSASAAEIDQAAERILKRFPDLMDAMRDTVDGLDALEAGEVDLVVTYNGDAFSRALENESLEMILPQEGTPLWLDSFSVIRDGPSPDLAHRFISHMSSPHISAISANELSYATANRKAIEMIPPEIATDTRLYPAREVVEKIGFADLPKALERHINRAVLKILTGSDTRSALIGTPGGLGGRGPELLGATPIGEPQ